VAYSRGPYRTQPVFGGLGGPVPRDFLALLVVVFATYAMQFFSTTAIVPALMRLSPAVYTSAFLWQLATYAAAGFGPASLWILLELLILYWFGRDVRLQLGRRRFWRLLGLAGVGAAVAAVVVELLAETIVGTPLTAFPFQLMQGQRILLVITIAAFATRNADATILLFFVLPLRAGWFLWLGILFGFVAFLSTKDLAGFTGICVATAISYVYLSPGRLQDRWRRWWLRARRAHLERRVDSLRRRRGLRVVEPDRRENHDTTIN
jgi:hypothetical protein